MRYDTPEEVVDRIKKNFTYHPPTGDQPDRYKEIREKALELVLFISERCPHSRERSTAIRKMEEAMFWANAAIARHEQKKSR